MPCEECNERDVPTTLVAIKDGAAPPVTIDNERMTSHMVGHLCMTCIEKIKKTGVEVYILPPHVAAKWMERSKAVGGTSLSPDFDLPPTAQLYAHIASDTFVSATKAWTKDIDDAIAHDVFEAKLKAALDVDLKDRIKASSDKWEARHIWMGSAAMTGIEACLEYLRRVGK